jgi:hypothetical protein
MDRAKAGRGAQVERAQRSVLQLELNLVCIVVVSHLQALVTVYSLGYQAAAGEAHELVQKLRHGAFGHRIVACLGEHPSVVLFGQLHLLSRCVADRHGSPAATDACRGHKTTTARAICTTSMPTRI